MSHHSPEVDKLLTDQLNGPAIDWGFTGDVAHAECAGAKAYAEMRMDGFADLRITDAAGVVLADITVRELSTDESITVSVMNVDTALLWSHARWVKAQATQPPPDGHTHTVESAGTP